MREILFRGKRIDNGEWIIGGIYYTKNGGTVITTNIYAIGVGIPDIELSGHFYVDPATVGQYTGLTDKNGTKIFEGDIVRAVTPNTSKNCCVKFEYGQFCIGICMPLAYVRHSAEVIGNILDNPERMEAEENV